ncbi:MAG: PriCT-2 domain-containing protein [Dialister invisus]
MSKIDLRPLLEYIPPAACSYKEWIDVGMALCHEGYSVDVWDEWSRKDPERYHEGECHKKWQSFKGNPNPVTGATLTQMAKEYGWKPHTKEDGNKVMDWDDTVTDNVVIVDQHYVQESEIKEPAQWNPADEIIRYLEALFDRSDKVGIVMSSFRRDDGKYSPSGAGTYSLTAGEYISRIKKYQRNGYSTKISSGMRFQITMKKPAHGSASIL